MTSSSRPPAYLRYVPAVFFILVALALYGVYSVVSRGVDTAFDEELVTQVVEEAKKVVEGVVREAERAGILNREARERKRESGIGVSKRKQRATRPSPGPLSDERLLVLDFAKPEQSSIIRLRTSRGVRASFRIDEEEGSASPGSARLSVEDMGSQRRERFATGLVDLPEPVAREGKTALELTLKGEGLKSFNVALYVARSGGAVGWSVSGVKIGEGWSVVTIPLVKFDLWFYNIGKKGYVYPDRWAYPEKIEAMGFFLRPENLADGRSGVLWIDSVALR